MMLIITLLFDKLIIIIPVMFYHRDGFIKGLKYYKLVFFGSHAASRKMSESVFVSQQQISGYWSRTLSLICRWRQTEEEWKTTAVSDVLKLGGFWWQRSEWKGFKKKKVDLKEVKRWSFS